MRRSTADAVGCIPGVGVSIDVPSTSPLAEYSTPAVVLSFLEVHVHARSFLINAILFRYIYVQVGRIRIFQSLSPTSRIEMAFFCAGG